MNKLKDCGVQFYPETHQYFYKDKELRGITGMLSRLVFPNKYKDVPKRILQKAAERGSQVHSELHTYDMFGQARTEEQRMYGDLLTENKIKVLANEYLVTDFETYATAIDKIVEIDGKIYLVDVKTTYQLDLEYLSWQLSINKYLFEIVNPDIEISGLKAIWVRDDVTLHEVDEAPKNAVISLLDADKNGTEFINPLLPDASKEQKALELIQAITDIATEIKELEQNKEQFNETLRSFMQENKLIKWETDSFKISLGKDGFSNRFDSTKFKADNPELYEQYVKQTATKGRLTITIK